MYKRHPFYLVNVSGVFALNETPDVHITDFYWSLIFKSLQCAYLFFQKQ